MKALFPFIAGAVTALVCVWLVAQGRDRNFGPPKHTFSSFDAPHGEAAKIQYDKGMLNLADANLDEVLNMYQEVSARTIIRSDKLPQVKISLHNQTLLSRVETLQLLDTTLAQNGVTIVLVGDASAKAVPEYAATQEIPPTVEPNADDLPDSSSYVSCALHLTNADPRGVVDALTLLSRMPKSIVYMPTGKQLILRDYSANVRQMIRRAQQLDHDSPPQRDRLRPALNTAEQRQQ